MRQWFIDAGAMVRLVWLSALNNGPLECLLKYNKIREEIVTKNVYVISCEIAIMLRERCLDQVLNPSFASHPTATESAPL